MNNFTLLSILMFNIGLIFNINDITINSSPLDIQNTQSTSPCSNNTNNVRDKEGWTEIGDVVIRNVTNDGDNGDGNGDGAIEVVPESAGSDKGVFYTFDCVMVPNQTLQIKTVIFNTRISYVEVDLQLYNSTDNRVIASETEAILVASTKTVSITYRTIDSDEGDQLQLRYLRKDDGNKARVFSIDRVTIEEIEVVEEVFDITAISDATVNENETYTGSTPEFTNGTTPVTFAISGGADKDLFTIDTSTGVVSMDIKDFETPVDADINNIYEIEITATDNAGAVATEGWSVTVVDVAEVFDITAISDDTVNENETYTGSTPEFTNGTTPVTFAISGGADKDLFTIDTSTGVVSMDVKDFETPVDADINNIYEIEITATDNAGAVATEGWSVTVVDVAEVFDITAISDATVNENETYTGSTPEFTNGTTPVTFAISGGADKDLFTIDTSTGVVSMDIKDFETPVDADINNIYEIEITATDNAGAVATEGWSVTVVDVAEVFDITAISDATVNENETYTGSTPEFTNGTTPVTFAISGGADKDLFTIDTSTGVVSMDIKDFETPVDADINNIYEIEITATDNAGAVATEGWSVTVVDVAEVFDITAISDATVNENETYTGSTPEFTNGTTPVTFAISGGADKDLFTIDTSTGVVSMDIKDFETPVDADINNIYEIEITATDNAGAVATEGWSVTVVDVAEVFDITAISDATVNENETYTGSTPEFTNGTTPVTFAISGGADKDLFTIDTSTGVVSMDIKDFETPVDADINNIYEIEITATDNAGAVATEGWSVTVVDVAEVFDITAISDATVNENETYTGSTPEFTNGTTPVTFAISGGADKDLFTIDTSTGVVSMDIKDFETPVDADINNIYEIEITATDNAGAAATEGWSVTVVDVEEEVDTTTTSTVADTDAEDIDINTAITSPCSNNTNNASDKEGWTEIGDVAIINVTNDNDNGDGNGDGAIEVVPESAGSDKGVFYTFDCVMVPNQTLQIETVIFNTRSSYVAVDLQLYNSTENRVIASKSESIGTDSNNSTKTVSITYRTIDSDEGDQLQLRYLRNDDGNKVRVFSIDRVTIEEIETDTENTNTQTDTEDTTTPTVADTGTDTEDIDINTATTSPCSNNTNNVRDKEGWTEIGDVAIINVTNDSDNGDGNGDGAIEVVLESAGNDKGIFYTFDCVMVPNQALQIETVIFNTRSSYVAVDLQLYNSTENRVMASETETILVASTKTVSITYRTIDSDEGDQLQLRYLRKDDGNKVRVFSIDRVTISSSETEDSTEVETDTGTKNTDTQTDTEDTSASTVETPIEDTTTSAVADTGTDTEDIDINTATTSSCSNNTNNASDKEGWTEIGDVAIINVTNDNDNGDGNGDGAIEVVPESAGSDKGVFYTFDCVMVPNQTLQIETVIFNTRSSYVAVDLQLYNSTENRVIASETETILVASTKTVSITYRTIDSDEGDQLQLRYLRKDDGNKVRVFSIDRVTISSSETEDSTEVETDTGTKNTDTQTNTEDTSASTVETPIEDTTTSAVADTGTDTEDIDINTATTSSCSNNTNNVRDKEGWTEIGDVVIRNVTNDSDNGDGNGDGAIEVVPESAGSDKGVFYTFDCVMVPNQTLQIETVIFNTRSSYVAVDLQLYNSTENRVIASKSESIGTDSNNSTKTVSITYRTIDSDEGDQLQLRYLRNDDGNKVRVFSIDRVTIEEIETDTENTNTQTDTEDTTTPTVADTGTDTEDIDINTATTSPCSNNTNNVRDKEGWTEIGDVVIRNVTNDSDNGDGNGDGAIEVVPESAGSDKGVFYTFDCVMVPNQTLQIETVIFNTRSSYVVVDLQLYNSTENRVMASETETILVASTKTVSITYRTIDSDEGDQLQLRYLRKDDGNKVRVFSIDRVTISSSETEDSTEVETDTGTKNTDTQTNTEDTSASTVETPIEDTTTSAVADTGTDTEDIDINTATTSSCSNNTNNVRDKEGWTEIGDVVIRNVTNDSDNGDGNGDGAIEVVPESAGSDKGVFYTFDCVMVPNQTLQIETVIFNTRSSYVAVDLQLYNSTENRVIASKSESIGTDSNNSTKTVSITYRTIDSDEGDQLQLRYLRNDDGNKVRVFSIDRVTIEEIETDTENTNTQTDTEDTTTPTVADTGTDTEDIDINTATTSPCSNNTNNVRDKEGWTEIGDVVIRNVTNDSDNGDGNGDGAIEVVPESAGSDKGVFYTFDCVMVPNQTLQIETVIFNTRSSYVVVDLQLYNSTENRVMASETETILVASTKTVSITYRTIDSDEGDQLQLRYLRKDDGNKARVFSIDRVTISTSDNDNDNDEFSINQIPDTVNKNTSYTGPTPTFTLPTSNYLIYTISETCRNSNNGKINISVVDEMNYTATVTGTNGFTVTKTFTDKLEVDSLNAGIYSICFTVDKQSDYKQCFDLVINEPEDLSVSSKIDISLKRVSLSLKGADVYFVRLNETTYKTSDKKLQLQLKPGINTISVETAILCQGKFEEGIFVSEEIKYFPNPVESELFIYCAGVDTEVEIAVYDSLGRQLYIEPKKIGFNRVIRVPTDKLIPGIYVVSVKGKTTSKNFKIIK